MFVGASRGARYKDAFRKYRAWCRTRHVKSVIRKPFAVKVWRGTSTKYPRISQIQAKAAALRTMAYWLDSVCREHAVDEHGADRATMIANFVKFDKVCRRNGRHLRASEHLLLCRYLEAALVSYNHLAVGAAQAGRKLYKVIPKFHAITHYYSIGINPRRVSCYQDEDMVGRMKRIYVRCHGATAPRRALQRYAVLACIRWWDVLRQLRNIPMPY